MSGALDGLRVLDLTTVVLGPYATQIMGDMGADVIKIETPQGDITRYNGPGRNPGMSGLFLNLNRNKRSVSLNLKSEAGKNALLRLVETADVFIHNMRADAAKRLGIDATKLREINPRLIHCASYGFSQKGRYASLPAYDDTIQAASGLAHMQGGGDEPRFINTVLADKVTGLTTLYSVMMALYRRERTGRGDAIEVPMLESVVSFTMAEHLWGSTFEPPVCKPGYSRILDPHRKPFPSKDGFMAIIPYSIKQWHLLLDVAGLGYLSEDPRFATDVLLAANLSVLREFLDKNLLQQPTAYWIETLKICDIAAMPVRDLDDVLGDPHLAEIEFFTFAKHPTEGMLRYPGIATQFEEAPGSIRRHAPRLGEHSADVLNEAGFSAEEIAEFIRAGDVIAAC